jgi:hypothetical protein
MLLAWNLVGTRLASGFFPVRLVSDLLFRMLAFITFSFYETKEETELALGRLSKIIAVQRQV